MSQTSLLIKDPVFKFGIRNRIEAVEERYVKSPGASLTSCQFWVVTMVFFLILAFCFQPTCAQSEKESRPDLGELISRLGDPKSEKRLEAIAAIQDYEIMHGGAEPAIPALQKLLQDDSTNVRLKVAELLFDLDIPRERIIETCVFALRDQDAEIRESACWLLDCIGQPAVSAIEPIINATDDSSEFVRRYAAKCLGNFGPKTKLSSSKVLMKLLDDPSLQVQLAAANSLTDIDESLDVAVGKIAQLLDDAIQKYPPEHSPFSFECECAESIERLGIDGIAALPALIHGLESKEAFLQISCAKAIATMGPDAASAIKALSAPLRDGEVHGIMFVHSSWCASDDAARALASIGIEAVPALIEALNDPNDRVRGNVANALGEVPESAEQSIPRLVELLKDKDIPVRACAAWALGKLGPAAKSATPELVQILFQESEWLSAPASGGIAQTFSLPWHAVEAIDRIQPDKQNLVAAFAKELSEHDKLDFAVATTIARIGPDGRPLIEKLSKFLTEPSSTSSAAFAIASLDPDFERLQTALESALIDDQGNVDRIAARGLALLGPRATKAIPRLRDAIKAGVDAEFVGGNSDIILAAIAILKIDNSDRLAAEQLLQALVEAHRYFDATASDEALRLLPGLATQNDYLKVHLVEQLSYQMENSVDDFHIDKVRSINLHARIMAAKILIKAGIAEVDTLKALENMYHESEFETRGEVIDLIGQLGAKAINQTHVLIESLADAEDYTVGGDFYGNGGEKNRVCDHAVQALVAIGPGAIAELKSKLNDDNKFSRSNTTKALGLIGNTETSVVDDLCKLLEDAEPLVRRETATALGRLAKSLPTEGQRIRESLNKMLSDHRPSVRRAADIALQSVDH